MLVNMWSTKKPSSYDKPDLKTPDGEMWVASYDPQDPFKGFSSGGGNYYFLKVVQRGWLFKRWVPTGEIFEGRDPEYDARGFSRV